MSDSEVVAQQPIDIRLYGRSDLEDFFTISGLWNTGSWPHQPVLAFVPDNGAPTRPRVMVITSARELEKYPDNTPCMRQWPGKQHSDFFKFTVGDARPYLKP